MAEEEAITMDCLCSEPIDFCRVDAGKGGQYLPLRQVVEEAEKEAIIRTLEATKNNRTKAAQLLGISRRALYDKLGAYGLSS